MADTNAQSFEIELTAMAHGGSALGRWQGRTVFVPYTIPGEIVSARPVAERGRVVFAEGVQLLDASADRVYPRCPHFGPGRCGRCQWQHIDYAAQLLLKQDVLADQLERVGGFDDADVRPVIASAQQWAYNHHMTLEAAPGGQFGFPAAQAAPAPDAHALAVIEECHLLHPDLLDLYYTLEMDFAGMRRLRLQVGTDGERMMIFSVASEDDVPELLTDLPGSINLILPDNEPVNLVGDSHSRFEVSGRSFRVTAGSDFRANVSQLERLAALVVEAAALDPADAVLDLYGGVGFFSAFLAPLCDFVTLVESYPPAATDADVNLADFEHVEIIEGSVEDILPEVGQGRYDVAVLDPPPAGLSVDAIDALAATDVLKLVYVSSDPATLARDLKRLVAKGFQLGAVQPIDLNPQTYYIDAVAVLTRANPA